MGCCHGSGWRRISRLLVMISTWESIESVRGRDAVRYGTMLKPRTSVIPSYRAGCRSRDTRTICLHISLLLIEAWWGIYTSANWVIIGTIKGYRLNQCVIIVNRNHMVKLQGKYVLSRKYIKKRPENAICSGFNVDELSSLSHYTDVIMGTMVSQITSSPLFAQPLVQVQIKENIKAPRHWPLWGEITGDRWIPRTKGQWRGKCFHLMTSS